MAIRMEDIVYPGGVDRAKTITWLPEPEKRHRKYTIFSCDDHLVEPKDTFVGRMPAKFGDRVPRVEELPGGGEAWIFDGNVLPNLGLNAVVGRPVSEYNLEPTRFEDMRRGAWDSKARVADMDLDGVYASLNFPSHLGGFGGGRLQTTSKDLELSLAAVRAWNEWHIEEWVGSHPDRLIACTITWLHDPELGAEEIRRNAARGCHAITFPETPHLMGFPSLHTDHWDPIMRACEETDTVVCLHTGSSGAAPATSPGAPFGVTGVIFGNVAMVTAIDWVYSMIPVRFPKLKICLSEGGIGWVPALLDRFDHCERFGDTWFDSEVRPSEVLLRNFSFCMLDDPRTIRLLDTIGADRVMFEVDYPHADTSWPNSQSMLENQIGHLPKEQIELIAWKNASTLFRHPVPAAVQADPNAF